MPSSSILPMEMPPNRISLQVLLIPEDSPSIPMTQVLSRTPGLEIPEDLFSIPEVMMERSRVVSLTRVVSFSIRGIPPWKIAINLNPASMIRVASSWTLKMMITSQL